MPNQSVRPARHRSAIALLPETTLIIKKTINAPTIFANSNG